MGRHLLIIFAFVINGACVIAQDSTKSANQDSTDISKDPVMRRSNPLVIVNAGIRTLQIPPAEERYHSFSLEMHGIEGSWIQSITVIEEQEAIDKYGALGQNGAVIVELKDDAFEKMPAHLAKRFKVN